MKFLAKVLDKAGELLDKNSFLKKFKPVLEATDEFLLGTGKVAKFAPHILDGLDIKRYMSFVIIALIPATLAGIYLYGLRVLAIIAVSYTFGGIIEVIFSVTRKKPLYEGFLVTGLIFPLILPPTIPLWMVAVGVSFGVFFGKEVFGGTGRNIFNPALVGRVFLSLAFPEYFSTMWQKPFWSGLGGLVKYSSDAVTQATPLINFKATQVLTSWPSLLLGSSAGSIGETFRIGIIIGGLLLILVKIADWRIPLAYLLSVGVLSFVANRFYPESFGPVLFQLLSGGLLFGAFFMATDPVTAPLTLTGKWVYGILLGILTVLIRGLTGFVEGVMFAILLTNAIGPLIDNIVIGFKCKKLTLV
jgi:RnfABCDGE-type electron transport complex D subunit